MKHHNQNHLCQPQYCKKKNGFHWSSMFEPADDVFLARLFDLDDDRDYEQDDHQATGDSNNGQVSVIQCFQDTVLPLLWLWKHNRKECLTLSRLTVGQPVWVPLQWFSSQGYTQFWIPLQTKVWLMHMLLWQKKVSLSHGAVGTKSRIHPEHQQNKLQLSISDMSKTHVG